MNYHYFIWMFIDMGIVVAVLSIGILVYALLFERDKDGTGR